MQLTALGKQSAVVIADEDGKALSGNNAQAIYQALQNLLGNNRKNTALFPFASVNRLEETEIKHVRAPKGVLFFPPRKTHFKT